MSSYYYLISSLPTLQTDEKPPITYEEFLEQCRSTVSESTYKRLESIISETETALDNGEYKYALDLADSIDYQLSESSEEKKWDIQREYWVEKVLKEAEDNGVELEYTPSEDIDKTKKKSDASNDE